MRFSDSASEMTAALRAHARQSRARVVAPRTIRRSHRAQRRNAADDGPDERPQMWACTPTRVVTALREFTDRVSGLLGT
jgi:hypothetical protein